MRRTIIFILVIALAGVLVYDAVKWVRTASTLNDVTYDLTTTAARAADAGTPRDTVGVQLVQMAAPQGVRVYQYDQQPTGVRVWTETDVSGTIILGGIRNMVQGVAAGEAFEAPFVIRDYGEAGIK